MINNTELQAICSTDIAVKYKSKNTLSFLVVKIDFPNIILGNESLEVLFTKWKFQKENDVAQLPTH